MRAVCWMQLIDRKAVNGLLQMLALNEVIDQLTMTISMSPYGMCR